MSELTKKINQFFRLATRKEVQEIKDKIYISEHLEKVFTMYYIEKKSISYIADITGYSVTKINRDLVLLREKINCFKKLGKKNRLALFFCPFLGIFWEFAILKIVYHRLWKERAKSWKVYAGVPFKEIHIFLPLFSF